MKADNLLFTSNGLVKKKMQTKQVKIGHFLIIFSLWKLIFPDILDNRPEINDNPVVTTKPPMPTPSPRAPQQQQQEPKSNKDVVDGAEPATLRRKPEGRGGPRVTRNITEEEVLR